MGKEYRSGIFALLAGATLFLTMGRSLWAGAERASSPTHLESSALTRERVKAAAAKWPLRFEENLGQVQGPEAREVRYVSRGSAYTFFLTSTEAVLVLRQHEEGQGGGRISPVVIRMRLSGGRPVESLTGQDKLPTKSNYFLGNDPSQWRTDVANYGRVAAQDVYPGIDLVYHGNEGQLEYDFDVAPQADPKKIRFALEGARQLRLDAQGDLLVKVAGGELRFHRPVAYQKAGGAERFVPVRYTLKGKNQVEFRLASYDPRQPLVIDPILSYSTYLGGSSIDGANGIAVAPDGTAFVAGGTFSTNFPTAHALQPNDGGPYDFPQDAFVSKISADGTTLVYSTYLGGENQDVANAIAVDADGEAFVTGTTFSPNFPVTAGSFNTWCGGDGKCGASWNPQGFLVSNAFVAKLNTAGSGLVYSGFLGYYENVEGLGIAVDTAKNAYVTGAVGPNIMETVPLVPPETPPPLFPCWGANGFQPFFAGSDTNLASANYGFGGLSTDGFIAKIDASASQILYCSYLGGTDEDEAYAVAVDASANAYVTGLTYSTDLPVTNTATYTSPLAPLQGTYSGAGDAFLSKVNTNGAGPSSLLYSTYFGGSGIDQGNAVAVDANGDAYLTGQTTSLAGTLGFTPPAGAYQPNCALDSLNVCEGDAFVAKFNPALSGAASLLYFTYLGGSLADSGTGIAVDTSGDAYVTGMTVSTNFPIFGPVFQRVYGGGNSDAFVTELNPTATGLLYSTYLGGSNTDTASGIAIDTSGDAFVAGQTCSLDFPLVAPLQPTYGGNCDAFVSKIIQSGGVSLIPAGLVFGNQDLLTTSAPQTITLTNGSSAAISITSIAVTGDNSADFVQTNTCGNSVPAVASCTISVTFAPTSVTPPARTAQITITDSGPGSPQVADLTGTAGTAPIVTPSSLTLLFGNQEVTTTSAPVALKVTNSGTAALTFTSITPTGDFALGTNTCTAGLQATTPASNCTINVTFTPSTTGTSVGALTLTDNAPDSPQVILLTGTGVAQPVVSLSATSLAFGSQNVNVTSAPQVLTVTNSGTATLSLGTISATGPFAQANTCVSVLPQGTCTVSVTFTPTTGGLATGLITLADNAANSPQTIALSGTGATAPIAGLAPASLTFATPQPLGTTSAQAQTATLSNTGSGPLLISSIAASGDFATATSNCGSSVAPGATCTITVTFTPTAAGNRYGTLTVTDNSGGTTGSTQTVALEGTGQGGPLATLAPSSLTFASEPLNTTSALQSVTLTNSGTATMTGIVITASGDFLQTNTCTASLAAGASCTINVTFTPSVVGTRTGALTITDSAPNSPQAVALTGGGADFSLSINPTSASVVAGNTASVTVSVSSASGFSSGVALTCKGLPALATCSASPTSVTPSGTTAVTSNMTISTTQRTSLPPRGLPRPPGPGWMPPQGMWLLWALVLLALGGWASRKKQWRWSWTALAVAALWLASFVACGGGGGTNYVDPTGTPAGTYTITVTGTSGVLSHSTTLTLTVQ